MLLDILKRKAPASKSFLLLLAEGIYNTQHNEKNIYNNIADFNKL